MNISGIDYLGLDRVIKRGTGEIIVNEEHALFIRDTVSGAYFLACDDMERSIALLDRYDCPLLMTTDYDIGLEVFKRYGFSEKIECYQVAYYGEKPVIDNRLSFKTADEQDLSFLTENYHLISPEEMEEAVNRKLIDLGYDDGKTIGFIGEHLEGSMGILYVLPEYRNKGYGTALQTHLIAKTIDKGYIPFGQVEKSNTNSLKLQKKIGMTQSEHLTVWMWK